MSSLDTQLSRIQSDSGYNFFSASTAANRAALSQTPLSFTSEGSAKRVLQDLSPAQRQVLFEGQQSQTEEELRPMIAGWGARGCADCLTTCYNTTANEVHFQTCVFKCKPLCQQK